MSAGIGRILPIPTQAQAGDIFILQSGGTNYVLIHNGLDWQQLLAGSFQTVQAGTPTTAGALGFLSSHLNFGDGSVNHVLVDTDSAQSITGVKTILSPVLTTALLTLPTLVSPILTAATPTTPGQLGRDSSGRPNYGDGSSNHVLVDTDTAQTLTNKTASALIFTGTNTTASGTGSAAGDAFTLTAGHGGPTGNGASVSIMAGAGGATSGIGGTATLSGGAGTGAFQGGSATLAAGAGGAGGAVGGNVNLIPGAGGGGSADGIVKVGSGFDFVSGAVLATTAVEGFAYIATCAGAPTGVPTNYAAGANGVPFVYDTTNHRLYYYRGGWHYIAESV